LHKINGSTYFNNAIVFTERAIKPKTIIPAGENCPDVYDLTGFTKQPIKEIMKEIMIMAKKVGDEGFQDMDLRFQDILKAAVVKTVRYWHKNRHIVQ